jgi:hypothetical protein
MVRVRVRLRVGGRGVMGGGGEVTTSILLESLSDMIDLSLTATERGKEKDKEKA